jgi:hypothetical protein
MKHTAYLVARLAPDGTYTTGIFSEPGPSMWGPAQQAVVTQIDAPSYAEADRRLRAWVAEWCPWLKLSR